MKVAFFYYEHEKKEECIPEDVEFGLMCLCCQGCQTPLPLCEHGGKSVFSAVYPVNEQEIHTSFIPGRDTHTTTAAAWDSLSPPGFTYT